MKEIDWEERHFQICLALIQGQATKPATPSFPYQSIIKMADKMIEFLKKHAEQNQELVDEIKPEKDSKKKTRSLWKDRIRASEYGISIHESKLYDEVWTALQESEYGFEKGCDIPFSLFAEVCEGICDVNDIDIEKFSEMFDVNIG